MSVLLRTCSLFLSLALKNQAAMLGAIHGDEHMARNWEQAPASKKMKPLIWQAAKDWILQKPLDPHELIRKRLPQSSLRLDVSYCSDIGEGNGNPRQYSCLENPVDRGAWWAAVYRATQSRTRLKPFSMHACAGEGNGNPLWYSCLENPRDGGAWWAAT